MRVLPWHESMAIPDDTTDELRAIVDGTGRWHPDWVAVDGEAVVAVDGEAVVAAAGTIVRPDDRTFLRMLGETDALGPLSEAVWAGAGRPIHLGVGADDEERLIAAHRAGYRTVLEVEGFLVGFDEALRSLRRAFVPSGLEVVPVTDVDERAAFDLDNELRNDVPGTDGWGGNRAWFHEEITADSAIDPSGYLVAVDRAGGLQGLIRFWRNPDRPRLGLIGVRRPHRDGWLAAGLLKRGLEGAAGWGSEHFATEASLTNRVVHPRLSRLAAGRTGISATLVYDPVRSIR